MSLALLEAALIGVWGLGSGFKVGMGKVTLIRAYYREHARDTDMCIYIYIHIYVYVHMYMCIYIYIYIFTHLLSYMGMYVPHVIWFPAFEGPLSRVPISRIAYRFWVLGLGYSLLESIRGCLYLQKLSCTQRSNVEPN